MKIKPLVERKRMNTKTFLVRGKKSKDEECRKLGRVRQK
jgi:hypothetical protein